MKRHPQMKNVLLMLSLFLTPYSCLAELKLPSIFSNNMMLQQSENVAIWGTDSPNSSVSVSGSWGEKISTTADKEGNWRIKILTPPASLDQSLTIQGSTKKQIHNVSIGDVWFCSGQSNMKFPVIGNTNQPVIGSNEAILNAKNKSIRLFNVKEAVSLTPKSDVMVIWQQATPASVASFGASCYFFGKKLNDILDTPIGLILSAYGASSAEAWTSKEVLSTFSAIKLESKLRKVRPQTTPAVLYNAMIYPLIGYSIKGFTWYQGENNRPRANQYTALFSSMIHLWRDKWGQGNLPFYFAQLAPYGNTKDKNGALLREAQVQTMNNVENTGMVSLMDAGMCDFIHPPYKKTVGDRLALIKHFSFVDVFSFNFR
jgi:sialate O-acetylesterase